MESRCKEGPRDWKNMFAITRFICTLCIKIVVISSSISPAVPFFLVTCWAFSSCIQNTENSLFRLRYKLALFNYYKYTILERQQWFNSFSIACVQSPLPSGKILREGRSVHKLIFDYCVLLWGVKLKKVSDGNCMGYESKVSCYLVISIQLNHLSIHRNKITLPFKAL